MPSYHDGLPSVALQAALRARPVIATAVGGIPEIVLHDKTGLLVERNNVEALTQAIEHLLDNPHKAAALGLAAQRHAQAEFNFEHYIDAYAALYTRLIAAKEAASAPFACPSNTPARF
jgi:glycosyltransferase involved in cell wall biosynthesis